jgi:hypothetical protein
MAKPDVTVTPRGKKVGRYSVADTGSAKGNRAAIRGYMKKRGGSKKYSTKLSRRKSKR